MKCNLELYLEAEELSCRRIAKTIHETDAHKEWLKTAEALLGRRREHIIACQKCCEDKQ